ncbi:MAG TPA: hypothetical protein VH164_05630, partial [Ktedonobacteraceae bacterium]|nr:hypothetical protein [Ktedonobacteraceae bacterium]
SSAAVGLGNLENERDVLITNPEQDRDRRPIQDEKASYPSGHQEPRSSGSSARSREEQVRR